MNETVGGIDAVRRRYCKSYIPDQACPRSVGGRRTIDCDMDWTATSFFRHLFSATSLGKNMSMTPRLDPRRNIRWTGVRQTAYSVFHVENARLFELLIASQPFLSIAVSFALVHVSKMVVHGCSNLRE